LTNVNPALTGCADYTTLGYIDPGPVQVVHHLYWH